MEHEEIPRAKTALARQRRATATRCERALWHELRAKRLDGWKFRREAPIGPYVADFVCFAAKLVVEADGPLHATPEGRRADQRRDAWFEGAGFRILHFSDEEILSDLGRVLDRIRGVLRQASPSPGLLRNPPSPSRGEGRAPSAPSKILVIACGALAREVRDVLEANRSTTSS